MTYEQHENIYKLFPDNHTEAKKQWNLLSEIEKKDFIDKCYYTDAASEHIAESWLEFVNAESEANWLENCTNWMK